MAKRRRRSGRRSYTGSKFVGIKVDAQVTLGALATNVVVSATVVDLSQDFRAISADLLWILEGLTLAEGPIKFGLCYSDYTVGEIAEAIDASPANDSDMIKIEHTNRLVRTVGAFPILGVVGGGQFNNGNLKRTKLGWRVSNAKEISLWAQNMDNSTITTGGNVTCAGTVWGVWL